MPSIHFVERQENVHKVPGSPDEWDSGYGAVAPETADRRVGGNLHLHAKQDAPSHFAGHILGWRVADDIGKPDSRGRLVLRRGCRGKCLRVYSAEPL